MAAAKEPVCSETHCRISLRQAYTAGASISQTKSKPRPGRQLQCTEKKKRKSLRPSKIKENSLMQEWSGGIAAD